jgi:flavin-dependent dehydrogenase
VVHADLAEVAFTFGLTGGFTRRSSSSLVSSVLRTEFDMLLLTLAEQAGAIVWQNCKAVSVVRHSESKTTVCTSRGPVTARFVVGADGANGIVARHVNPRDAYFWQTALYCEAPEELIRTEAIGQSTMRIDWGTLPSGYGWVFPKGGTVNIGVGCPNTMGKALRPYLQRFLSRSGILKPGAFEKLRFRGHPLPTLTSRTRLSGEGVLLVGDAAGLVEPLTGEGISNACHSAEIVSKFILNLLHRRIDPRERYDDHIRSEIGCEISRSRQLLSFAVAFPQTLLRKLTTDDAVWDAFCGVLRGDTSFLTLRQTVLGRCDALSKPLNFISRLLEMSRCRQRAGLEYADSLASIHPG